MTTVFPGSIDSYSVKVDGVDDVLAAHINDPQDAIVAIETLIKAQGGQNLLYDSLTHDIWPLGTTFNDHADGAQITGHWYGLHDGNAPDVTGEAGGGTDPFSRSLRVTSDTAGATRAGYLHWLSAEDSITLRGKTVSLSCKCESSLTNNMRMMVVEWSGTADAQPIEIVSVWNNTPTLVANAAFAETPSAIDASSGMVQRVVNDIDIADDVNNVGVFIWFTFSGSGQTAEFANFCLELGAGATEFRARLKSLENFLINGQFQSNIFINGGFDLWQRTTDDTGVTTTRKYVADRWAVITGAGTLAHVQRSTTVRSGGKTRYSCQLDGAAGVTTVDVDQRIEAAMSGLFKQIVSFSAYVYNGSGSAFTPTLFVSTPSAADNWTVSTVRNGGGSGESLQECADSAWTRVVWAADISGYTDIDNGVELRLRIPSGSLVASDTVRLAEMSLTPGGGVMEFVGRPIGLELALCQRYYEIEDKFRVGGYQAASGYIIHRIKFSTEKRSAPTVAKTDGTTVNVASSSTGGISATGFSWLVQATALGALYLGNSDDGTWQADAEL